MVWYIEFESEHARRSFEKLFKIKPRDILYDDNSYSYGFVAHKYTKVPGSVIYYMGFCGYADAHYFLREHKEIKIKRLIQNPINDLSYWETVKGRKTNYEKEILEKREEAWGF